MNIHSILVALLMLLILASCEKSITINLPEQPRRLVLNAVVLTDSNIHAHLTRTLSNAESGKGVDVTIPDARVLLYRDAQVVDTLKYDKEGEYLSQIKATPGHQYKLVVTHLKYPSLEAETGVPGDVPVQSWSLVPNAGGGNNGTEDQLSIHIKDPATPGDYYIVQLLNAVEQETAAIDFYSGGDCVHITDPSFESTYTSDLPGEDVCFPAKSLLVKDVLFNGQEKEMKMSASSYLFSAYQNPLGTDKIYPVVHVNHVTEQFYNFVKSYRILQDISGNPFAEPYNMTSNVKGGYGIFTILSRQSFEVIR